MLDEIYEVVDVVASDGTPVGRLVATNADGLQMTLEAPSPLLRALKVGDEIECSLRVRRTASQLLDSIMGGGPGRRRTT